MKFIKCINGKVELINGLLKKKSEASHREILLFRWDVTKYFFNEHIKCIINDLFFVSALQKFKLIDAVFWNFKL